MDRVKLLFNLRKIEKLLWKDETLHFLLMFFISTIFQVTLLLFCKITIVALLNIMLSVVLGFGKEYYDKFLKQTTLTATDIIATITGGFVSTLIIIILYHKLIC